MPTQEAKYYLSFKKKKKKARSTKDSGMDLSPWRYNEAHGRRERIGGGWGGVPIGDRRRQTKKVGWPGGHVTVRDMRR